MCNVETRFGCCEAMFDATMRSILLVSYLNVIIRFLLTLVEKLDSILSVVLSGL